MYGMAAADDEEEPAVQERNPEDLFFATEIETEYEKQKPPANASKNTSLELHEQKRRELAASFAKK